MAQKNGRIRYFCRFLLLVLLFATPAAAQQMPSWELFMGYSFQRSDVREYFKSTPIIYTFRGQYANLDGWEMSLTENRNRWFGGTLDFSGHYGTPRLAGITNRERTHSVLYGPRFSYALPWITPFVHALFGITHTDVQVTPVGPHASDLSLAAAAGGGLDIRLGSKAAVRLFQAEYIRNNTLGTRPHGLRASAGFVFNLGSRK